jgi:hypothetical protein
MKRQRQTLMVRGIYCDELERHVAEKYQIVSDSNAREIRTFDAERYKQMPPAELSAEYARRRAAAHPRNWFASGAAATDRVDQAIALSKEDCESWCKPGSTGRGAKGVYDPLGRLGPRPTPLGNCYKISSGNRYINSVWTPLTLEPCGPQV